MSADRRGSIPAANGRRGGPDEAIKSSAFDFDLVCVALGLLLAGIALWIGSADVDVTGILFAALAAYAAWLDGANL